MLRHTKQFVASVGAILLLSQNVTPIANTAAKRDSIKSFCLELTGIILDFDDQLLNKASITVYRDSMLFMSAKTSRNGKCSVKLPLDSKYTIVFSKEGFISKKIIVNCDIPYLKHKQYKLAYKIYLFEKVQGLDTTLFNDPVAYISFDRFYHLDYDYKYTQAVNRKAGELYRNYYSLEAQSKRTTVVTRPKWE